MNALALGMFFLGLAIGLLGTVVMCMHIFKAEDKSLQENFEFIRKWSKLTDDQYKNFETYFDKRMDSLDKFARDITHIAARMADESDAHLERINDIVKNECDLVGTICDELSEAENVNSERWFLLKDYILNKEDKTNEHAYLAKKDGAPEGGDVRDQEAEQAPVVSGKENAVLVRGELEEDGGDSFAEAEEREENQNS